MQRFDSTSLIERSRALIAATRFALNVACKHVPALLATVQLGVMPTA